MAAPRNDRPDLSRVLLAGKSLIPIMRKISPKARLDRIRTAAGTGKLFNGQILSIGALSPNRVTECQDQALA